MEQELRRGTMGEGFLGGENEEKVAVGCEQKEQKKDRAERVGWP